MVERSVGGWGGDYWEKKRPGGQTYLFETPLRKKEYRERAKGVIDTKVGKRIACHSGWRGGGTKNPNETGSNQFEGKHPVRKKKNRARKVPTVKGGVMRTETKGNTQPTLYL